MHHPAILILLDDQVLVTTMTSFPLSYVSSSNSDSFGMQICFDQPTEQEGHALSVLASMTNGDLLRMSTSQSKGGQIQGDYGKSWKSPMDSSKLLGLGDTINSFSVDSLNTRDVICCSSAECLVYLHRS